MGAPVQTYQEDGKAYVRGQDGVVYGADPQLAAKGVAAGKYTPVTAEEVKAYDRQKEAGSLVGKAKTFAESSASAALDTAALPVTIPSAAYGYFAGHKDLEGREVGNKDPFARASGRTALSSAAYLAGGDNGAEAQAEYDKNARARALANPLTRAAGQVAGTAIAGVGASGVARGLGTAAELALGSPLVGTTVAGALEGAALGRQQASEEAYIKDEDLTAESAIASMGWGALIGGGVGLAVHGAGRLFSREGSRGATPFDSPRLGSVIDNASDTTAGEQGAAAAATDVSAKSISAQGLENTRYLKNGYREKSLADVRAAFAGATPEEAEAIATGATPTTTGKQLPPVDVNVFPDGERDPIVALADGRHRMAVAKEMGATHIDANITYHDAQGVPIRSERAPLSIGAEATAEAPADTSTAFSRSLRGFAEERTGKALGLRGIAETKKLGRTAEAAKAELHRMTRDVLDYELDDGTKVFGALQGQGERAENLLRAQEEVGQKLGSLRDKASAFVEEHAPQLKPNAEQLADRIEQEIAAPLRASAVPDVAAKAAPVERMTQAIRSLGPEASLSDLTKLRQDLDSVIYPKAVGPGLPPLPPAHAQELAQVRGMVEEQIQATMDKAVAKMDGGSGLPAYAKLKGLYRSFREASQIAGKEELRQFSNRVASPSDYLTGGAVLAGELAAGGGVVGGVKAVAAMAAHHAVREHASAMLAVLADRLASNIEGKIGKGVGSFLARAAVPGSESALRSAVSQPARSALTKSALELFQGRHPDPVTAYRKRVDEVQAAAHDFGSGARDATAKAVGDLAITAPKLAGKMVSGATRGAMFLQSKITTPPADSQSFTPNASRPIPSDLEISKFARYWSAVSSPLSVVRDLERGTVTSEQVEALQVVYPKLYDTIRTAVMGKLRELDARGKQVPYAAALQLDLLLNLNGAGVPTAAPAFMANFQQMKTQVAQRQAQNAPRRPVRLGSSSTSTPLDDMRKALP